MARRSKLKPAIHITGLMAVAYAGWIFAGQDAFLEPNYLSNALASLGFS